MKNIWTISFLLTCGVCFGQNLILNSDFELYSSCPSYLGQIDSAVSWLSVVQSSDYYNCGMSTTSSFPSNSTAYSGTGYVGFASYGGSSSSAESIGQILLQPLFPNETYSFSFAAKRPYSGGWADTCASVSLYGYKSNMPLDTNGIHLSQLANSILLGTSMTVRDTAWQLFSFDFIPIDTINSIALTVQQPLSCHECIFFDYAKLYSLETSITDFDPKLEPNIHPNPFSSQLTFSLAANKQTTVSLYNFVGQQILQQTFTNTTTINAEQLADGIYFYELRNHKGAIKTGKVVKQ